MDGGGGLGGTLGGGRRGLTSTLDLTYGRFRCLTKPELWWVFARRGDHELVVSAFQHHGDGLLVPGHAGPAIAPPGAENVALPDRCSRGSITAPDDHGDPPLFTQGLESEPIYVGALFPHSAEPVGPRVGSRFIAGIFTEVFLEPRLVLVYVLVGRSSEVSCLTSELVLLGARFSVLV